MHHFNFSASPGQRSVPTVPPGMVAKDPANAHDFLPGPGGSQNGRSLVSRTGLLGVTALPARVAKVGQGG